MVSRLLRAPRRIAPGAIAAILWMTGAPGPPPEARPPAPAGDFVIAPGQCINEALGPPDQVLDNNTFFDRYELNWPGGDLTIVQTSAVIDSFLIVIDPSVVQTNVDEFFGGSETFFRANAPAGTYFIFANSFDIEVGEYEICVDRPTALPEVVIDGGLEASTPNPNWIEQSVNFPSPICSIAACGDSLGTVGPRTGNWWAWFGGTDTNNAEAASLEQAVTIPGDSAVLTFYLWNGASSGNGVDSFRASIDGVQVFAVTTGDPLYATSYARVKVDISAFAGGAAHTLRFETSVTGSALTNFSLDDVSIRGFEATTPAIRLDPGELTPMAVVDTIPPPDTFTIANSGIGTLSYTISDDVPWIDATPVIGTSAGEADTITVNYLTTGLPVGVYAATISASDPQAANSPQLLPVTLTIVGTPPPQPVITLSTASLSRATTQDAQAAGQAFAITNGGATAANFAITDNQGWLTVEPETGSVGAGQTVSVFVTYDTVGLAVQIHNARITVSVPAASNSPQTIDVAVQVDPRPPLRVTAPHGVRTWQPGSTQRVNWTIDPVAGTQYFIDLRETVDNSLIPITDILEEPITQLTRSALLQIPSDTPPGIYVVRVTSVLLENNPAFRPGGAFFAESEARITVPNIFPGQTINGTLEQGDFTFLDTRFFDLYALDWPGGDLRVTMRSVALNSQLIVEDTFGQSTAVDTGFDGEPETLFVPNAPAGGYVILTSTFLPSTGAYELEIGNPPPPPPSVVALDFTAGGGDAQGWLGGELAGLGGSVSVQPGGICMTVAGPGDNGVGWISPANFVPLMDRTVYRLRFDLSTDQSATDAIPLLSVLYTNQQDDQFQVYGGERWIWDATGAGGANGISRTGGLDRVTVYIAPISLDLPQWRTSNALGGTAFSPEADAINDMRLFFRILDFGGGADPLSSSADSGTICIEGFDVTAVPLANLRAGAQTVYGPALNDGSDAPGAEDPGHPDRTHFPQSRFNVGLFPTVQADIRGGTWEVKLPGIDAASDPDGVGFVRATLGPDNLAGGEIFLSGDRNPARLNPIPWEDQELYLIRAAIRSDEPAEGNDPVNVIILNYETFTAELGGTDYVTSGADLNGAAAGDGGGMFRAGSPRRRASTGGVTPEYQTFFYSNNLTASPLRGAGAWKAQIDLFNRADLDGGAFSGQDALAVERLQVDRILRTILPN